MKVDRKILGRYSRPWEGIANTELIIYNNSLVKSSLVFYQGFAKACQEHQYWFSYEIENQSKAEWAKQSINIHNSCTSCVIYNPQGIKDFRKLYNEIFS